MSSQEVKVERPCPKDLHFHGKKNHKHQNGNLAHDHHSHAATITSQPPVVRDPAPQDSNTCLEGTLAGGVLGGALGGTLAKKRQLDMVDSCWRCRWRSCWLSD